MDSNRDWQPGDPIYTPLSCFGQPMIALKEDHYDIGSDAARWTPDIGWRETYE